MDIDDQVAPKDAGEMRCEMIMCIESGSAFELKWCPLPTNDAVTVSPCQRYVVLNYGLTLHRIPRTLPENWG